MIEFGLYNYDKYSTKGEKSMDQKQSDELLKVKETVEHFDDEKLGKLKRYQHLNTYAVKGQTLFVGSSLMEQFPINEFQQALNKKIVIYNRGVGGFVTNELLAAMDTCIFELAPTRIFINIGTNDIAAPDYKKENLIVNYDQILSEIKDHLPHCQVFVMAYYPVNQKADFPSVNEAMKKELFKTRTNPTLQEANVAIKELAQNYQYEFIDVNDGLVDEEGNLKKEYTVEGIHFWPNAYYTIFNNLKQYL